MDIMKILSLFDGMSCGYIAMKNANVKIDRYVAYEIDKYAVQVSQHNFPDIEHKGDVFKGDFTEYEGFDFVIGGSPCFTKGHLVLTDRGYVPIEDIQVGDMVLTHRNRYRKVLAIGHKDAPVHRLKAYGHLELTATGNHPFPTRTRTSSRSFSDISRTELKDLIPNESYLGMNITEAPMDVSEGMDSLYDGRPYPTTDKAYALSLQLCAAQMSIDTDIHYSDGTYTVYCVGSGKKAIDNQLWTPVTSVSEDIGIQTVYNMTVDEDHSYTVDNVMAYNCTYWSIAQTKNRETEAHGIGWELFQQYVRGIREAKPKYFIYENNKSMADNIKKEISSTFGFEPIMINSALVSAQNRQRYYWVGIRQKDGTYRKANIEQPEDRGILLRDILDGVSDRDKARTMTASIGRTTDREYFVKNQNTMAMEPIDYQVRDGCTVTITDRNIRNVMSDAKHSSAQESVVYFDDAQTNALTTAHTPMVINSYNDEGEKSRTLISGYYKASITNLTDKEGQDGTGVAEPVNITSKGKSQTIKAQYGSTSVANICKYTSTYGASGVAEPIPGRIVGRRINEEGHRDDYNEDIERVQRFEANEDISKTNTLTTVQKDNMIAEPVGIDRLGNIYGRHSQGDIIRENGKCPTVTAAWGMGGHQAMQVAEQIDTARVCMTLPNSDGTQNKHQSSAVLDTDGKMRTLTAGHNGRGDIIAEPVNDECNITRVFKFPDKEGNITKTQRGRVYSIDGKSSVLLAETPCTDIAEPVAVGYRGRMEDDGQYHKRFEFSQEDKSNTITTVQTDSMVAEPLDDVGCIRMVRTEEGKELRKDYESHTIHHGFNEFRRPDVRDDGKTNTLTTVQKDNMIAESVQDTVRVGDLPSKEGNVTGSQGRRIYSIDGKSKTICASASGGTTDCCSTATGLIAEPMDDVHAFCMTGTFGERRQVVAEQVEVRGVTYELEDANDKEQGVCAHLDMPGHFDHSKRVYAENGKAPTITARSGGNIEPKVFSDTSKVHTKDRTPIYEVKDGQITIKGKTYPIKLRDGHYIIRKLTVNECKRLQTIPDWYDMTCISNTQAYKCLGNGWTADVITHLILGALKDTPVIKVTQSSLDVFLAADSI